MDPQTNSTTPPPLPNEPVGDNSTPTALPPADGAGTPPPLPSTPEPTLGDSLPEPTATALEPAPSPETGSNDQQQVTDKLKNANNVLVTVGSNPSVDELASALGLTLLLDKLGKHATTVFSGEIPRAIEFLDPEATFENNVDSLRDFIIALDKEKADKLRYKVEEDVVRIFITPYKTKISEDDLEFSQGDFNVDVVVALGVVKRDELDKAITSHGRILHDATVVTVNAGDDVSSLGAINWADQKASSVAEMLVSVGDKLGSDLLDSQTSTAFLTGIVAATNRFSNEKTSPKVMTLAAQLMAAGANQQLIASNLRQDGLLSESVREPADGHEKESEVVVEHDKSDKKKSKKDKSKPKKAEKPDSSLPKPPAMPPTSDKDDDQPTPTEAEKKPELELPSDLKEQLDSSVEPEQPTSPEPSAKIEPSSPITDVKADTGESNEPQVPPKAPEPSNDEPAFNATMAQQTAAPEQADGPGAVTPTGQSGEPASEESTADADAALEEARKAVESATEAQDFNPANQPIKSLGSQPLPDVEHAESTEPSGQTAEPTIELIPPAEPAPAEGQDDVSSTPPPLPSVDVPQTPAADQPSDETKDHSSMTSGELDEPDTSPMDSFMSAHGKPMIQPETGSDSGTEATPPSAPPAPPALPPTPSGPVDGSMPPLPPMPSAVQPTDGNGMPPLPPSPNQPYDPTAAMQPSTQPDFMQNTNASQNPWTQAADDLSAQNEQNAADRQAKMDKMADQYDTAVDRNRELQGLPPLNDPNGTGMPPVNPDQQ